MGCRVCPEKSSYCYKFIEPGDGWINTCMEECFSDTDDENGDTDDPYDDENDDEIDDNITTVEMCYDFCDTLCQEQGLHDCSHWSDSNFIPMDSKN